MEAIGMHIGFWITITALIAGIAIFGAGVIIYRQWDNDYADGIGFMAMLCGALAAVGAAAALAIGLFPYKPEYWPMYRIEGTVTSVSNVLSEDGGDLTRTPVIELDTWAESSLVLDDARAVNIDGKHVALRCSRTWVYQGMDRYECTIQAIK